MAAVLRHRGREITHVDVEFVRALIAANPGASRRALSQILCEAWDWRQQNGALKDSVCRSMLLELHRADHIELPEARWKSAGAVGHDKTPPRPGVNETPIRGDLAGLGELRFEEVRRSEDESMFDGLIEAHHYLGYTQPVGEHLKFLVFAGERPVACFAWSSAPRHLGPRDRHIGWSRVARKRNILFVAYNSRFLILPWVEVPNLASHLLGRMTRMLPRAWKERYAHPVWFAETFVDPTRFHGTCYRASNWTHLGQTTGRGKDDQTNRPNRTLKDVYGLGLHRRFRELLR